VKLDRGGGSGGEGGGGFGSGAVQKLIREK